jgi:hypothetical protein
MPPAITSYSRQPVRSGAQLREPLSASCRNRVRNLSPGNQNQCVEHLPGSHTIVSRSYGCTSLLYSPGTTCSNSKIIRLAGRAIVSDRGPLACCATGQAASREGGPVRPLTCGVVFGRIEEARPGMLSPSASTRTPPVRIYAIELEEWSYGDSNPRPLACHQQAAHPQKSIRAGHRPQPCTGVRDRPTRLRYFRAVFLSLEW